MKITKKTIYEITFFVQAFWPTEGGMDEDQYGDSCKTIEDAIIVLEAANLKNPNNDWMIVCEVEKTEPK